MTTANFDLQRIQRWRKLAMGAGLVAAVSLAALTGSINPDAGWHEGTETFGLACLVVCIVGRAWCSLYIGGRKKVEIVSTGPYSISRNPLYIFSFIGAFGVGAQTGSVTLAIVFTLMTLLIFHFTVQKEESWLTAEFGDAYRDYRARTPRYGPDFSKWRDNEVLEIRPKFFVMTLRDGLVFLLAFPVFELVEILQHRGVLITLAQLP